MMNKKILSIILSVFLVMSSFAALSVSAEFSDADIAITANAYEITVKATSDASGTMTARLVNEANDALYGIASNSTPSEGVYTFTFYMPTAATTGNYTVYVGNNVPATSKTFNYVRLDDKIEFYDNLELVAADGIASYFATNVAKMPVAAELYEAYTDFCPDVLALINAEIYALNLDTGVVGGDTADQKIEKLNTVNTLFTEKFAEFVEVGVYADAALKDWDPAEDGLTNFEAVVADAFLAENFDDIYYVAEEGEDPVLAVADVYEAYKTEAAAVTDFELSSYIDAFGKATLVQIANTKSFGIIKEAFLYYEEAGAITPDMTDIDALVDAGTDGELWKALKASGCTDSADLVSKAETKAGELNTVPGEDEEEEQQPVDKPTKPSGIGGTIGGGGSTPIKPAKPSVTFTDLTEAEWARKPIEALAKEGIVEGIGDGKFAPNDTVSNEEYIKMILGAFDLVKDGASADFDDVAKDRWSYIYLASAKELGIISSDVTTYNPAQDMTRQDMAVVVYRVFKLLGIKVSGDVIEFTDTDALSDEAKEAIAALTGAGILNGMGDGTFAPNGSLTRAQAAKVIYYLMNLAK